MKHGKREMPRQTRGRKGLVALMAMILVLCCAAGGTVAWLTTQSGPVTNTFTPSRVGTEITEGTNNGVKSNVQVKNTGDVDAYVRAAVIINWLDSDGNVCGTAPAGGAYKAVLPEDKDYWMESGGYYYYKGTVAADALTSGSLLTVNNVKEPAGYHLQVTILAEAIQTNPESAVADAWGMVFRNNSWVSANSANS